MPAAFIDNTNVLELSALQADGTSIDDATVTLTVLDPAGDEVSGASWPMTMIYVVGSEGTYRAILPDDLGLASGRRHLAVIDADGGDDLVGHWEFPFWPTTRTG